MICLNPFSGIYERWKTFRITKFLFNKRVHDFCFMSVTFCYFFFLFTKRVNEQIRWSKGRIFIDIQRITNKRECVCVYACVYTLIFLLISLRFSCFLFFGSNGYSMGDCSHGHFACTAPFVRLYLLKGYI